MEQLDLLQKGTSSLSSDFYTYRYLATEGFLPEDTTSRACRSWPLCRPRTTVGAGRRTSSARDFLALSEFGPRSLVYHEGRAYRVVRAMLSLSQRENATADSKLPTKSVRICKACGAGHFNEQASLCHSCGADLGDAENVNDIYRIENVATQPAERITANDEERQRQGFELQTTFEWAVREHAVDVRRGAAVDGAGEVARLIYGSGATITRLNKGLRRRADRTRFGFKIDPVYGYWARNDDEEEPEDPTASPRQWIVPCVRDHKNALLLQPLAPDLKQGTQATVQHALLRGIEVVFQLEAGEILAEPMPTRDARSGFLLYEATEGGAGVLTRLVAEPASLANVALKALQIMHFDIKDQAGLPADGQALRDAPGTACVAACYKCLMSYYNQPDHELIDRRDHNARELLIRLARSTTTGLASQAAVPGATAGPAPSDPALARWLELALGRGLPPPDAEPLVAADRLLPLVWRDHYVAAAFGDPGPAAAQKLEALGFELVSFDGPETQWAEPFRRLAAALGRQAMSYSPGSLVRARGREWIVLTGSDVETLRVRPVSGSEEDHTVIHLALEPEPVAEATFPPPGLNQQGSQDSALLLRDALLLSLRRGAGPFRSFGQIAVAPRAYQLVPLLMALKQDTVRLLIADDVGVGKTIEAALIARELLDRGEIDRTAVSLSPAPGGPVGRGTRDAVPYPASGRDRRKRETP